jgi:uncharacterized Zn finger protein (UPF0148 family)
MTGRERCATCGGVLLWADGRLVCPRPACPGHKDRSAVK